MWVDVTRCTGCGVCVKVCPVEAIALVNGKAHIAEEVCTGCGACVNVCPVDAIQPVVQGELVPAPGRELATARRAGPLTATASAAVFATSVGLLARLAGALIRTLGRWLTQPSSIVGSSSPSFTPTTSSGSSRTGRGYRARHRRRGK
ncbi:MAG: 4Fe-4S binding protein [Chloroflexi bacterium]|nr:4Fe-4S binding protein [Chloroflexota bacterium]